MNRSLAVTTLLASMVLTLSPPAAVAQVERTGQAQSQGPTNAALVYWRVFDMLPREHWVKIGESYSRDPAWAPDAEVTKILEEHQGAITKAVMASGLEMCDWGLDHRDGLRMLLPHLSKMRGTVRLLLADARRLMVIGDTRGAAERIAAAVGMSTHCTGDRVLISSLVSNAIFANAAGEMEVLLSQGKATEADRAVLRRALARVEGDDPFNITGALRVESVVFVDDVERELTGPQGPAGAFARIGMGDLDEKARADAAVVELMSVERIREEFERLREEYAIAIAGLDTPGDAPEVRAQAERIESGKAGPLVRLLLPNLTKIREAAARGRAEIAKAKALVG
jgi:hypothetical protein